MLILKIFLSLPRDFCCAISLYEVGLFGQLSLLCSSNFHTIVDWFYGEPTCIKRILQLNAMKLFSLMKFSSSSYIIRHPSSFHELVQIMVNNCALHLLSHVSNTVPSLMKQLHPLYYIIVGGGDTDGIVPILSTKYGSSSWGLRRQRALCTIRNRFYYICWLLAFVRKWIYFSCNIFKDI